MHYAEVTSEGEAINNHFHVFDWFNTIDSANNLSSNCPLGINWEVLDYLDDLPSEDPQGFLLVLNKSPKEEILNQTSIAFQQLFHRNFPLTNSRFE